jgi:circadian clock protein KaiC
VTRLSTGLADLDLVLGGGLAPGASVVLAGPPGTGKTVLAQQICFANATNEHKALYYTTMAEPHAKIIEHLTPFSFFESESIGRRIQYIHVSDMLQESKGASLQPLVSEIVRNTMEEEPALVVIDSAKMLRNYASKRELRQAFYDLTSRVAHSGTVLLLLGEYVPKEMRTGVEFSLADGIIQLSYQSREPVDRRWLRVVKMRGRNHLEGKHTFHIGDDGFQVYPRIETIPQPDIAPVAGRIDSGTLSLDNLMRGGLPKGDATLVLGPSGAGKTIFSLRYVAEGLAKGERCLYITFQDTADQLISMAAGFGYDFETARAKGQLDISHVPMGSLDLDVLASTVRHQLMGRQVSRVVLDSLAEMVFAAREGNRFPAYLRSLTGIIRAAGASKLVTSETTTLGPLKEPLHGLMFLFHNVIHLRYLEQDSEVGLAINILKMRNSPHDKGMHLCRITSQGLVIDDKVAGVGAMLGWSVLAEEVNTQTAEAHTIGAGEGN